MKMYDFGYTVIEAWALLYLGFSVSPQLPWATCNNTWNTGIKILKLFLELSEKQSDSEITTKED